MVIIHGGKIINPIPFPLDGVKGVAIKRKAEYSFSLRRVVVSDKLTLIIRVEDKHLYEVKNRDLFPGDVIQQGGSTITIEDISKLDSDSRKDFYCEQLTNQLNDMVMLDKNLK